MSRLVDNLFIISDRDSVENFPACEVMATQHENF